MRKEYDFANSKGRRNPHVKGLKKQVTLRLGVDGIEYFKALAEETGMAVRRKMRNLKGEIRNKPQGPKSR